jgi:DNA-binding winged helix-turn-helix (wHTH) protein
MGKQRYHFATFELDPRQRRLTDGGAAVELSGRYFDALHLLVAEAGSLVTKERFHAEVWKGIPVTDEALTQCIRSLRRALDDEAAMPRFIETVPKYGYRFVAPVRTAGMPAAGVARKAGPILADALAAAMGGGAAGLVGGALYASMGLVAAGLGAASTMLAFMSLCLVLGLLGGGAVGLGIALGGPTPLRSALGGAAGGLLIGALAGIVGNDLFVLLFGRAPQAFTGALDSAAVGLATGFAVGIAGRLRRATPLARLAAIVGIGAAAGAGIALAGGRLLAGSLAQLTAAFPESPLRLDGLRAVGLTVATAFEVALFASFVTTALLARRRLFGPETSLLSD